MVKRLTHATLFAAVYLILLGLFHSFYQKFGGAPEWITGMFADSPLSALTGIGWACLGILQFLALAFAAISIYKLEFWKPVKKEWLGAAAATGFLCMAVMGMGSGFAGLYDQMYEFVVYMVSFAAIYLLSFAMSLEVKDVE